MLFYKCTQKKSSPKIKNLRATYKELFKELEIDQPEL